MVLLESERGRSTELKVRLWSPDRDVTEAVELRRLAWAPEQSASEVGDTVVQTLERAGLRAREMFEWGFAIAELQMSLALAVSTRRGDPGAVPLRGRLVERVTDDWYLTDAGIECPSRSSCSERSSSLDRSTVVTC